MFRRTFLGSIAALPLLGFLPRLITGIRAQYFINWQANNHKVQLTEFNDGRLTCTVDGRPTNGNAKNGWTTFCGADGKGGYSQVKARLSEPGALLLDFILITELSPDGDFIPVGAIGAANPCYGQMFGPDIIPPS